MIEGGISLGKNNVNIVFLSVYFPFTCVVTLLICPLQVSQVVLNTVSLTNIINAHLLGLSEKRKVDGEYIMYYYLYSCTSVLFRPNN